jgi:hypothetical protein
VFKQKRAISEIAPAFWRKRCPRPLQSVILLVHRRLDPSCPITAFLVRTDAHAKNYAFLLGAEGAARLAPLYDLASVLPYPTIDQQKAKLAMKLGGEYRLRNISLRNWQRLAADVRIPGDSLIDRIRTMTDEIPDHAADISEATY